MPSSPRLPGSDRSRWGAARLALEARLAGRSPGMNPLPDWAVGVDEFDPRALEGMGVVSSAAYDNVVPLSSVPADRWGTSGGSGEDSYMYDPDALAYVLKIVEQRRRQAGGLGGPVGGRLDSRIRP